MRTERTDRAAFSLTEMLVVVGIIVLVAGMLLPSMMKSRQQARLAVCQNNLRQLGGFYLIYADRNDDYIPLGTTRWNSPGLLGNVAYTPVNPATNLPYRWPAYHIHNNHYAWLAGAPSAAMGPFILSQMIKPETAKILSCPTEQYTWARTEFQYANVRAAQSGSTSAVVFTSYGVRPVQRLWTHDPSLHTVQYPGLMPKLSRNDHFALLAEDLQPLLVQEGGGSFNHGSDNGFQTNVLYGDGSVRPFSYKLGDTDFQQSGFNQSEIYPPINEDDPTIPLQWQRYDKN